MLHDLAAEDQLGGVLGGLQLLHRRDAELRADPGRLGPRSRLRDHLRRGIRAADPQAACREAPGQLALAAADLVRLDRARPIHELEQLPDEARHEPPLDGIGGPVLVVDVAAGLGRRRGGGAQTPTSLRSRLPGAPGLRVEALGLGGDGLGARLVVGRLDPASSSSLRTRS